MSLWVVTSWLAICQSPTTWTPNGWAVSYICKSKWHLVNLDTDLIQKCRLTYIELICWIFHTSFQQSMCYFVYPIHQSCFCYRMLLSLFWLLAVKCCHWILPQAYVCKLDLSIRLWSSVCFRLIPQRWKSESFFSSNGHNDNTITKF